MSPGIIIAIQFFVGRFNENRRVKLTKIVYNKFNNWKIKLICYVETNPGTRRPVPAVCRILCSNVRGLAGKLSDLTVASSQYDILLCSEILVLDLRLVSELLVRGYDLLCRGKMPRARGISAYVRDGYGAFRRPNLSVVVAKCCFLGLWCETEPLCVQSLPQP